MQNWDEKKRCWAVFIRVETKIIFVRRPLLIAEQGPLVSAHYFCSILTNIWTYRQSLAELSIYIRCCENPFSISPVVLHTDGRMDWFYILRIGSNAPKNKAFNIPETPQTQTFATVLHCRVSVFWSSIQSFTCTDRGDGQNSGNTRQYRNNTVCDGCTEKTLSFVIHLFVYAT